MKNTPPKKKNLLNSHKMKTYRELSRDPVKFHVPRTPGHSVQRTSTPQSLINVQFRTQYALRKRFVQFKRQTCAIHKFII